MKKVTAFIIAALSILSFKTTRKRLLGPSSKEEALRVFLGQIHNRHIRENIQYSESPRDAAILVVQDALEIAGGGKIVGRILDVVEHKGLYIVKYEFLGTEGAVSYMPNTYRGGYAY